MNDEQLLDIDSLDRAVIQNLDRIEAEFNPRKIKKFVRAYFYAVEIRWTMTCACLTYKHRELFEPERCWKIYLRVRHADRYYINTCLFHEILHVMIVALLGLMDHTRYEDTITAYASRMAEKWPEVSTIFEELFPGLDLSLPLKPQLVRRDWYVELRDAG